jgi:hypothetical protein
MRSDLDSPTHQSSSTCYFSYVPSPSTHFSVETPYAAPTAAQSFNTVSDPLNPLLAFRELAPTYQASSAMDSSKLLQLQTSAAHGRPAAQPVQHRSSVSSSNSDSSDCSASSGRNSPVPQNVCCARCRRTSIGFSGMVKIGMNLFYCNHCATMVGYGGE